jgi:hypothetical protein
MPKTEKITQSQRKHFFLTSTRNDLLPRDYLEGEKQTECAFHLGAGRGATPGRYF